MRVRRVGGRLHRLFQAVIGAGNSQWQQCTFGYPLGLIESEQTNRYFTRLRESFDDCAGDAKVIRPLVKPRMKKADDFPGSRIDGSDVGTFITIAEYAA